MDSTASARPMATPHIVKELLHSEMGANSPLTAPATPEKSSPGTAFLAAHGQQHFRQQPSLPALAKPYAHSSLRPKDDTSASMHRPSAQRTNDFPQQGAPFPSGAQLQQDAVADPFPQQQQQFLLSNLQGFSSLTGPSSTSIASSSSALSAQQHQLHLHRDGMPGGLWNSHVAMNPLNTLPTPTASPQRIPMNASNLQVRSAAAAAAAAAAAVVATSAGNSSPGFFSLASSASSAMPAMTSSWPLIPGGGALGLQGVTSGGIASIPSVAGLITPPSAPASDAAKAGDSGSQLGASVYTPFSAPISYNAASSSAQQPPGHAAMVIPQQQNTSLSAASLAAPLSGLSSPTAPSPQSTVSALSSSSSSSLIASNLGSTKAGVPFQAHSPRKASGSTGQPSSSASGPATAAAAAATAVSAAVSPASATRPPHSYPVLITQAIDACSGKATLQEIYAHISSSHAYYATAKVDWRNAVRHNLSLSKRFELLRRDSGRGGYWTVNPEYKGRDLGIKGEGEGEEGGDSPMAPPKRRASKKRAVAVAPDGSVIAAPVATRRKRATTASATSTPGSVGKGRRRAVTGSGKRSRKNTNEESPPMYSFVGGLPYHGASGQYDDDDDIETDDEIMDEDAVLDDDLRARAGPRFRPQIPSAPVADDGDETDDAKEDGEGDADVAGDADDVDNDEAMDQDLLDQEEELAAAALMGMALLNPKSKAARKAKAAAAAGKLAKPAGDDAGSRPPGDSVKPEDSISSIAQLGLAAAMGVVFDSVIGSELVTNGAHHAGEEASKASNAKPSSEVMISLATPDAAAMPR